MLVHNVTVSRGHTGEGTILKKEKNKKDFIMCCCRTPLVAAYTTNHKYELVRHKSGPWAFNCSAETLFVESNKKKGGCYFTKNNLYLHLLHVFQVLKIICIKNVLITSSVGYVQLY